MDDGGDDPRRGEAARADRGRAATRASAAGRADRRRRVRAVHRLRHQRARRPGGAARSRARRSPTRTRRPRRLRGPLPLPTAGSWSRSRTRPARRRRSPPRRPPPRPCSSRPTPSACAAGIDAVATPRHDKLLVPHRRLRLALARPCAVRRASPPSGRAGHRRRAGRGEARRADVTPLAGCRRLLVRRLGRRRDHRLRAGAQARGGDLRPATPLGAEKVLHGHLPAADEHTGARAPALRPRPRRGPRRRSENVAAAADVLGMPTVTLSTEVHHANRGAARRCARPPAPHARALHGAGHQPGPDPARRAALPRGRGGSQRGLTLLEFPAMSETVGAAREDLLRTVAAGTAGVVGEAFLQRLVQSVGETFGAGVCWVSELVEARPVARALACWPPMRCPRARSTRSRARPACCCTTARSSATRRASPAAFPEDAFLIEHGLDGYLAVACPGSDGAADRLPRASRPSGRWRRARTSSRRCRSSPPASARRSSAASRRTRLRAREAESAASRAPRCRGRRRGAPADRAQPARRRPAAAVALGQHARRRRAAALEGGDAAEAGGCSRTRASRPARPATSCASSCTGCTPSCSSAGSPTRSPRWPCSRRCRSRVDALPDRRLPDAVEATIFYLVSEALTNAVKHAGASRVRGRRLARRRLVHVTVADDGAGGADRDGGTGLPGLRGPRARRSAGASPSRARRAAGRRSRRRSR